MPSCKHEAYTEKLTALLIRAKNRLRHMSETVINLSYYRGTTQIDASEDVVHLISYTQQFSSSAHRTSCACHENHIIYAAWITGTVPADAYCYFRPASKVHSEQDSVPLPTSCGSLCQFHCSYYSSSQVSYLLFCFNVHPQTCSLLLQ